MISSSLSTTEAAEKMQRKLQMLDAVAADLRSNMEVRDRKYHLRTYGRCFVASDAVDYLVNNDSAAYAGELIETRQDAVDACRALQVVGRVFEHVVSRDKVFADSYLFFRFVGDHEEEDDDEEEDGRGVLSRGSAAAAEAKAGLIAARQRLRGGYYLWKKKQLRKLCDCPCEATAATASSTVEEQGEKTGFHDDSSLGDYYLSDEDDGPSSVYVAAGGRKKNDDSDNSFDFSLADYANDDYDYKREEAHRRRRYSKRSSGRRTSHDDYCWSIIRDS